MAGKRQQRKARQRAAKSDPGAGRGPKPKVPMEDWIAVPPSDPAVWMSRRPVYRPRPDPDPSE